MSTDINIKIDKNLGDEVKEIAQNKFPLRKIEFYSEAVREALIEFIKKNKKFKNKPTSSETNQSTSPNQEQIKI